MERRVLLAAAVTAVAAVAIIAGLISYGHMHDWAQANGEPGWRQPLFPLSVDGLVIAASIVLLTDARLDRDSDWLAWLLVVVGAVVSVTANVAHDWQSALAAKAIAAWPPLALIGSYELLMRLLRRLRATTPTSTATAVPVTPDDPATPPSPTENATGTHDKPATTDPNGRTGTSARRSAGTDTELLAILADPQRVPRNVDGTVPIRRARTALGCGPDRARRLLRQTGLLANPTHPAGTPARRTPAEPPSATEPGPPAGMPQRVSVIQPNQPH